ncbi:tRNA splicing endonuclease 54 homolog (Saccharomyces cerevisiae) [Seminavis robusta]|uniref:tRNA splicing endonuclease 54 homolog (Saccharomyces cerevisiae) n=1 Tax=Seminavis robusta TaxID=568900 RepID=A0A9N8DTI0_9STRA|nr:tRNA splicing endonuclease 54 homolog (Saccharomyces cerevisiae) [Seminavis robusta]|eukprot:Sro268_g103820.1 tRNA splicing endonuclease 54 homolog (Saccharomyces cerevisiae) (316) ;mRNA; f:75332-76279
MMPKSNNDDTFDDTPNTIISKEGGDMLVEEGDNDEEESKDQLPICCHLDKNLKGMFRVTRAKSKAFQSGGFGVTVSTEVSTGQEDNGDNDDDDDDDNNGDTTKSSNRESHEYLFLEEVLFLFEQGMLECHDIHNDDTPQQQEPPVVLTAPTLYGYLEPFHVPTVAYLTYAHLRQQTFRVVRYTEQRLALLQDNDGSTTRHRRRLRKDVQTAPPPTLATTTTPTKFAYCVYPPSSQFAKTHPGMPSFLVAVTHYNQSSLDYATVRTLLQQAQGIPIKIATVSDSGTVVMFGITDHGVPPLHKESSTEANNNNNKDS